MVMVSDTRLEEEKIRELAQKSYKSPTFIRSALVMLSFIFYTLLFNYYNNLFPLVILAFLAPLLSLLILITPKTTKNIQKIFSIYGVYAFIVFVLELYWIIRYLPSMIMDVYYSIDVSILGSPLDVILLFIVVIFLTLFLSLQFLKASKMNLIDPFESESSQSIYGYGILIFACLLFIIIIRTLRLLGYI